MRVTVFDYGAGNLHSLAKAIGGAGMDVRFETDFRSVYARVLDNWLGAASPAILGGDFRAGAPPIV